MERDNNIIFKFLCGGFFDGYWQLEIRESRDGRIGKYSNTLCMEPVEREFDVSEDQMRRLYDKLESSGAEEWYCHYFSPILDGTQWELLAFDVVSEGSNAFPEGFDELAAFLSEEFGCEELNAEGARETRFPDEMDGIGHIAAYSDRLVDLDAAKREYDARRIDEDELGEARSDAKRASRELLHDIYILVGKMPALKDYGAILKRHGVPLDARAIAAQDMAEADEELIVASMLAISRSDRFDGYSDDFGKCSTDGTFSRWLERLCEMTDRGM